MNAYLATDVRCEKCFHSLLFNVDGFNGGYVMCINEKCAEKHKHFELPRIRLEPRAK